MTPLQIKSWLCWRVRVGALLPGFALLTVASTSAKARFAWAAVRRHSLRGRRREIARWAHERRDPLLRTDGEAVHIRNRRTEPARGRGPLRQSSRCRPAGNRPPSGLKPARR